MIEQSVAYQQEPSTDFHETFRAMQTPLGPFLVSAKGNAVVRATFVGAIGERSDVHSAHVTFGNTDTAEAHSELLDRAESAIRNYFAGELEALDEIAVHAEGSEFEKEVWTALRKIPAGRSKTYGQLARELGRPGSARAVGRGCGLNPICLFIPCHRIIGSQGKLVGFSAGLERKKFLLQHEGITLL